GIAIATGDVLAFTDDDVNVDETWIEAIRAAMHADDAALVGGPVVPRWERRAPWWLPLSRGDFGRLAAPLALVDYGPCASDLGPRTLLGANLAVRRNVLQQIGGFAPHLGKLRGTLLSGEEHEFCHRVQAAGFRARNSPDVRVYHWVPVHRMRFRYFLSWFFWSGITNATLDETGDQPERGRPMRSLGGVPAYIVGRFFRALVAAPAALSIGRPADAVARAMDVSFAAGYAARRWGLVKLEPAHRPVP